MALSFDSKIKVPDSVMVSQLEGESVLLNLETESYFGLDQTGTRFWGYLTASESIQRAYEQLLAEYTVDEPTLRADLTDFVNELLQRGLVEIS